MFLRPESRPCVGILRVSNESEQAVGYIVFKVVRCECVNIAFQAGVCVDAC